MRKFIFLILSGFLFAMSACTRAAKIDESSKIVIQIPTLESSQNQTKAVDGFVNNLLSKGIVKSSFSSTLPTGFDGTSSFNCFLVMVSGPESSLQENHCKKTDASAATSPVDFRFGIRSKLVGLGGNIEMELTSGPDRVFRLIGFHSASGSCNELETNQTNFSKPYIVGEKGGVNLDPGATKTIEMMMSYNQQNYFDKCEGPDFNHDGGGSSPGSNNEAKSIAIKKDFFPVNKILESRCQSVDLVAYGENNNQGSLSQPVEFELKIDGVSANLYPNYQDCVNAQGNSNRLVFPSSRDRFQAWFMGPPSNGGLDIALSIGFVSNPTGLTSTGLTAQLVSPYSTTFDIDIPRKILGNVCYEAKTKTRQMDGAGYSLSEMVNVIGTNGLRVYSDSMCTNEISSVIISYGDSSAYFVKVDGTSPNPTITFSYGVLIDAVKVLNLGSGSVNLANLQIEYNNQTQINFCNQAKILFMNEDHTAIPLPVATQINFSGAAFTIYGDESWCMSSGLSAMKSVGATSHVFSYRPLAIGMSPIEVSIAGLAPMTLNVNTGYQFRLNAYTTGAVTSVPAGTCVEAHVRSQEISTGNTTGPYSDLTVSVATSFPLYKNSGCTNSTPNIVIPGWAGGVNFYFFVDNTTNAALNSHFEFTASQYQASGFDLSIDPRPNIQIAWDASVLKIPAEYPMNMLMFSLPFTGLGPYSVVKNSGFGTLAGNTYTATDGQSANFTITDSRTQGITFSTSAHSRSYVLDFMPGVLPPGYTFSRASSANYFDSAGDLIPLGSNLPRFDHNPDPASGFAAEGLLLEPAANNYALNSENLNSGYWTGSFAIMATSSAVTVPTGGAGFTDVVAWNFPDYDNMAYYKSSGVANPIGGDYYTGSVFVKKDTSRFVGLKVHAENPNYGYSGVVIDLDLGTVVGMIDPWSGDVSSRFGVQKLKNGWFRIWTSYFCKGAGPLSLYLYPVYHGGTTLSPYRNNQTSGQTYFWGAQLENGPSMTSYMPASATPGYRVADTISYNLAATFPTFEAATESSIRVEYNRAPSNFEFGKTILQVCGSSCYGDALTLSSTNNDAVNAQVIAAGGGFNYNIATDTQSTAASNNKLAVSLSGTSSYGLNLGLNSSGATSGAASSVSYPDFSGGNLYIGYSGDLSDFSTIHIRKIELWNHRMSIPALKNMTGP